MDRKVAIELLKQEKGVQVQFVGMSELIGMSKEYTDKGRATIKALDLAIETLKQTEIVRCKDCKHYSVEGDVTIFGYCNGVHEHDTDPNGYCHHGERKGGDE